MNLCVPQKLIFMNNLFQTCQVSVYLLSAKATIVITERVIKKTVLIS